MVYYSLISEDPFGVSRRRAYMVINKNLSSRKYKNYSSTVQKQVLGLFLPKPGVMGISPNKLMGKTDFIKSHYEDKSLGVFYLNKFLIIPKAKSF